ncbi:MAG: DUF4159 domain-containing protein [Gemmatimonadaceae bacterium]
MLAREFVWATAQYESGDWDSAPLAGLNVTDSVARYTSIKVSPTPVIVSLSSADVLRFPFLFLTGHLPVRFTESERRNVREFVDRGGFLFVDDHNHDIDGGRWTRTDPAQMLHVRLDTVPDATHSAWLAALRGTGARVSWSASDIPVTAVAAFRSPEPSGDVVVLSTALGDGDRVLSDDLGPIDTLSEARLTHVSRVPGAEGALVLTAHGQPARAYVDSAGPWRRVLVIGTPGWESKFVIAALEERGWLVDSRMRISPEHVVTQGSRAALDTSRWSAVVLLDSTAAESTPGVERFAREGGGVVLAADASSARNVAALLSWRAAAREVAPLGTAAGDTTWRGMSRVPLDVRASPGAIVVESHRGRPAVVVRRHYAGRVAAVGYDQTWRWRMAGGDNSVAAHSAWWSRIVASVALPDGSAPNANTGSAPLASLHDKLGAPAPVPSALAGVAASRTLPHIFGAFLLGALLAEWVLRRRRGAA